MDSEFAKLWIWLFLSPGSRILKTGGVLMRSVRLSYICALIICLGLSANVFGQSTGAVFVNTNQTTNEVWSYARASDGTLTFAGKFATQGSGSGTQKLDSQGSIALSRNGKYLFVVN